ncbi:MAG: endonuclease/exonuclease/phosphatase family protein [Nannocystaceae bacterium]
MAISVHPPAIFDLRALPPRSGLHHELGTSLDHLASLRRRRHLRRDPIYRHLRPEILRLLRGFAWDLTIAPPPTEAPTEIRAVAWNIERGKRWEPLRSVLRDHPVLSDIDLLFLTEVDIGMGRSQNRNVAAELAEAIGMNYVFANQHLVLAPGDSGEQDHHTPNTLALHGCALFSRWPIRRFAAVPLPERRDKFHALEKRLGQKRTLVAEIELSDGPLTAVVVHLDPFASPRHRAAQLRRIVASVRHFGGSRILLGGDLNTNTYNLSSPPLLVANLVHKLMRFGVAGTIEQYMTPDEHFERPVFDVLSEWGLTTEGYNDPAVGTAYYDVNDPEVMGKTLEYVPKAIWAWIQRRLEPWGGVVPLRFDWFAGRGLRPVRPRVIDRPTFEGRQVSDHNPIVVDLALDPTEE